MLAAAMSLGGCTSLVEGAKQKFSDEFTCPIDRVQAKARPEMHPSDFDEPRKPSAEIAGDPGRLKMWQDEQAQRRKVDDSYNDMFEASGCGHTQLYACHKNQNKGWVSCTSRERPKP